VIFACLRCPLVRTRLVRKGPYRLFLGIYADPFAGLTPDEFCRKVIEQHIAKECKGKLRNWTDWDGRREQQATVQWR